MRKGGHELSGSTWCCGQAAHTSPAGAPFTGQTPKTGRVAGMQVPAQEPGNDRGLEVPAMRIRERKPDSWTTKL